MSEGRPIEEQQKILADYLSDARSLISIDGLLVRDDMCEAMGMFIFEIRDGNK